VQPDLELLQLVEEVVKLARVEVHGPEAEIDKLREPLAALGADFFVRVAGREA
jgi:hypothetical protein